MHFDFDRVYCEELCTEDPKQVLHVGRGMETVRTTQCSLNAHSVNRPTPLVHFTLLPFLELSI